MFLAVLFEPFRPVYRADARLFTIWREELAPGVDRLLVLPSSDPVVAAELANTAANFSCNACKIEIHVGAETHPRVLTCERDSISLDEVYDHVKGEEAQFRWNGA